ncbi:hypothetical protein [Vibrio phage vB_VpM-pA2SJ1]|uniref:Uncharacterized protein n=1 Tax=Vibrio phage vB_VpM-pA2SJ1 TaxID=3095964 RepID=A0AAX4J5Q0_9CAUD|nr:hypothetical protein vBVpP1_70 [Vibrio phage vB_VpP_1]
MKKILIDVKIIDAEDKTPADQIKPVKSLSTGVVTGEVSDEQIEQAVNAQVFELTQSLANSLK